MGRRWFPHRSRNSPPEHVVFHPGLRKAGSTSIQRLLGENADILGREIEIYSRDPLTQSWRRRAGGYARYGNAGRLRRLDREIGAVARRLRGARDRTVLISDENLAGSRVARGDGTFLWDWTAEVAGLIRRRFAGTRISVVLYTREPEAWVESCYNQAVKYQGYTGAFADWRAALPSSFTWQAALRPLKDTLGDDLEIVSMEEELRAAPFLGHALLRRAGIPEEVLSRLTPPPRQNESLAPSQLAFMRGVNALALPAAQRKKLAGLTARNAALFSDTPQR